MSVRNRRRAEARRAGDEGRPERPSEQWASEPNVIVCEFGTARKPRKKRQEMRMHFVDSLDSGLSVGRAGASVYPRAAAASIISLG